MKQNHRFCTNKLFHQPTYSEEVHTSAIQQRESRVLHKEFTISLDADLWKTNNEEVRVHGMLRMQEKRLWIVHKLQRHGEVLGTRHKAEIHSQSGAQEMLL